MSGETIVAKRYAKALFEVAQGQNKIAIIGEELQSVVELIHGNQEFEQLLTHPNIDTRNKIDLLNKAFQGKICEELLNTLCLLVENRREALLPSLQIYYVDISNEALGQARAIVSTPFPLTEKEKDEIIEHFGKLTGKKIRVELVIDKSLLGGLQVRIGDRIYDGSLSGKLGRLQKSLQATQAL